MSHFISTKPLVFTFLLICVLFLAACSASKLPEAPTAIPASTTIPTSTPIPPPTSTATVVPTQTPSPLELFLLGWLPYPTGPADFEPAPADTSAADADILFNPENPSYAGEDPSTFRQLLVNEIAQGYNEGKPEDQQLIDNDSINNYFNANYRIMARVTNRAWTFVVVEKQTGNVLIPMVDNGQGAFLPHATMLPIDASGHFLEADDQARLRLEALPTPRGTHAVLTADDSGNIVVGYYDSSNHLVAWADMSALDPALMVRSAETGAVMTPEAPAALHDMSTWPEDMRDYWTGGNTAWADTARSEEFNAFVQGLRADMGFQSLGDYMRYGQEHPEEILVFTTDELRQFIADSLGRQNAIFACNDENGKIQNGIYADVNPSGRMTYEHYIEYYTTPEGRAIATTGITLNILGRDVEDLTPSFQGAIGDVVARFQLPGGIDPAVSEGIIMHFHLDGQHRYLPLIINYQPVQLPAGSLFIYVPEDILQYTTEPLEITPVRSSLLPDDDHASDLSPQQIQALVGTRVHAIHNRSIDGILYFSIFPYGLGIQTTSVIEAIPPEWDAIFSEPIVPFP